MELGHGPVRGRVREEDLDDGVGLAEHLVEEAQEFGPLHPRQVLVDDQDLDPVEGLDELDGLDAARGRVDVVGVAQKALELLEVGQVVVDEDDGRPGRESLRAGSGLFHGLLLSEAVCDAFGI